MLFIVLAISTKILPQQSNNTLRKTMSEKKSLLIIFIFWLLGFIFAGGI